MTGGTARCGVDRERNRRLGDRHDGRLNMQLDRPGLGIGHRAEHGIEDRAGEDTAQRDSEDWTRKEIPHSTRD